MAPEHAGPTGDTTISNVLERVSDAFVALDNDWCYTYVNEKAAQIFGRSREDLIGKHIWTEFPEGVGQPFHLAYERAVATQEQIYLEEYYPPYDRWFENRIYPSPDGLTIFFTDVTDRKKAEDELRRINRALAVLGQANQAVVRIHDEQQLLDGICRICVEVGGYRLAWVGFAENDAAKTVRPAAEAGFDEGYLESVKVTWADEERGRGPTGTAIRTGAPVVLQRVTEDPAYELWRDAALRHGYNSSVALPLTMGGPVIGALSLYAERPDAFDADEVELLKELAGDVALGVQSLRAQAERAAVQLALGESELRFERFFNDGPVPQAIVRASDHRYVAVNAAFLALHGHTRAEVVGRTAAEIALWVDPDAGAAMERLLAEQGTLRDFEIRFYLASGEIGTGLLTRVPIELDGETHYLGSLVDITRRKAAEDEVQSLNADLELRVAKRTEQLAAANKALEAFSYSVSHDLRAPLRAITGFSEIVAERYRDDLDEQGRRYLGNILQASERMSQLIDDLLAYSRLGRRSIHCVDVDLNELVGGLAIEFAPRFAQVGGSLAVADDLPPVLGDPTLLGIVLTNLLENAVNYRRETVALSVGVDARVDGDDVVVSVADNGCGIHADCVDKVFNIFQRLHSDDEVPGTGIGLANVRKAVELMEGSVWVESEEGEGSTFFVRVPRYVAPVTD